MTSQLDLPTWTNGGGLLLLFLVLAVAFLATLTVRRRWWR